MAESGSGAGACRFGARGISPTTDTAPSTTSAPIASSTDATSFPIALAASMTSAFGRGVMSIQSVADGRRSRMKRQRAGFLAQRAGVEHRPAHPIVVVEIEEAAAASADWDALERLHRHGRIRQRARADDVEIRGVELVAGRARRAEVFAPPGDGVAVRARRCGCPGARRSLRRAASRTSPRAMAAGFAVSFAATRSTAASSRDSVRAMSPRMSSTSWRRRRLSASGWTGTSSRDNSGGAAWGSCTRRKTPPPAEGRDQAAARRGVLQSQRAGPVPPRAQGTAKLNHPNVVAVYDIGEAAARTTS